jgi:predicted AAA+ superfamily ATPase
VPDFPKVRVEISGPRRAGKSVLVAHFQSFVDLAGAVNNLRKRGLEVEFVETQTGELEQIDATVGFGGRP